MIEDSSFDRKILVNILAKEGYKEVIEVKDGDESVTKYKTEKLALVLRYYYEKKRV